MKRSWARVAAVGAAFLFVSWQQSLAAGSDVTLRIGSYGGTFDVLEKKFVSELFTEHTGIKVEFIDAAPTAHLAKLIASKGREAPYDLVILDGDVQTQAIDAGVLAKLDPSIVKNLQYVYPEVRNQDGYGPAIMLLSIGIAYNPEKFAAAGIPEPTSWADLWDPRLAGHVSVPSLENVMGRVFMIAAAKLAGGDLNSLDKGIAKIAELKVQSYYVSSTQLEPKFQSGDVWVAPWINQRAWGMALRGQPMKFVIPKEGGFGDVGTIDMIADSQHKAEAQAYINFHLDLLPQLGLAFEFLCGPTNSLLAEPLKAYPEVAQRFPSSPAALAQLNRVDWHQFWPKYPQLLEAWNRTLLNK